MADFRTFIRCPACGYEDREIVDYPDDLRRDGDVAETECANCGESMKVTLSVTCEYATEKPRPPRALSAPSPSTEERCYCGKVKLDPFIGTYTMVGTKETIDHTRDRCTVFETVPGAGTKRGER